MTRTELQFKSHCINIMIRTVLEVAIGTLIPTVLMDVLAADSTARIYS